MEKINPVKLTADAIREKQAQEKAALSTQLAIITRRLTELELLVDYSDCTSSARMKLSSYVQEYYDDGYVDGFRVSSRYARVSYSITTNDPSLAYLAILAQQPHPIQNPRNELKPTSDRLIIRVDEIDLPDGSSHQPPQTLHEYFETLRAETADIVVSLYENILENHPFKKIPQASTVHGLDDILLRKALLEYCQKSDPDFSMQLVL